MADHESLMAAWEGSCCDLLGWWQERLVPEVRQRVQFPALVAAKRGPQALEQTPRVIVGTIHSVKGGQADVVYLFPDLSQAGDAQYRRDGPPRDSVIRQFYVGVTRAREKLYVCGRESSTAISIWLPPFDLPMDATEVNLLRALTGGSPLKQRVQRPTVRSA